MQKLLIRLVPVCFGLGAFMELFMIKTGFYEIVTRKEAERRAEQIIATEQRQKRLKALQVDFEISKKK